MSKEYGLIVPKKKNDLPAPKPSIFESDSDSDDNPKQNVPTAAHQNIGPRRQDLSAQKKALEEDPTVFQYDEIYDEMESRKTESKLARKDIDRKPKYINRLLQTAARRKRENELRIERQVQKEREAEGDEFKDKEEFVTSAYRKKLEELRELEEQEKREEYLEKIGDVTKQADLGGFYRHLYEQRLKKPEEKTEIKSEPKDDDSEQDKNSETDQTEKENKMKNKKQIKDRKYRKRKHSESDHESSKSEAEEELNQEKIHLPSNLDADSDFSIESSSDEDEETSDAKQIKKEKEETQENGKENVKTDDQKDETTSKQPKPNDAPLEFEPEIKEEKKEEFKTPAPPVERKPKIDIWKKRTVGEVFDAALQRYYERKNARLGQG